MDGGGSKYHLRTLDGCADLLGGVKPNFEFLGGSAGVYAPQRTLVPTYVFSYKMAYRLAVSCTNSR